MAPQFIGTRIAALHLTHLTMGGSSSPPRMREKSYHLGWPVAGAIYLRATVDRQLQALHDLEPLICREEGLRLSFKPHFANERWPTSAPHAIACAPAHAYVCWAVIKSGYTMFAHVKFEVCLLG